MTEVIVAVDGYSFEEAEKQGLLDKLSEVHGRGMIWGVKISDMLYSGDVPRIISTLKETHGLGVMADAKLHDIPSTMEHSLKRLVDAGADIVTVHCSSNFRPIRRDLLKNIAGVTVPTSFTDLEVKWIYERGTSEIVKDFADMAQMNRYAYILGSVQGLRYIAESPLKKICTGIRPHWYRERHDQVRVDSVKEAVRLEASYIVVGRPILESDDIVGAVEKIYAETT
ncbi:MAG: orotidine 5'-phosphate decarboxylase / HUMPS family protein [Syntrophorhabdales bacterium]|jgi:orotidine-5'-phosphate decarboxylase